MIIENPEIFRFWLSTVLEPLCDADPVALAKYVYALVKKDKPVNDLRTSMVEQLDVFLQEETQSFVALLFKTIENKEYLNVKKDGMKEDKKLDDTKLVNTLNKPTDTSGKDSEKTDEKENDDQNISSTDEKQNGVQIQSSVVSEGTVLKASEAEVKPGDGRDERKKENERDDRNRLNRNRNRTENSLARNQRSRSRSWDRLRRSRSRERDRDRGDRAREKDRIRLYRNKSPPRRYDRGFDRRRTYSRSPSPLRYRVLYPTRSKSKSRSPKVSHRGRFRNRSPSLSRSRSPRSRSRSRSFERKTPNQDNNHGDIDMSLQQAPHSGNENDCERFSKVRRCRDYDEKGYCLRGELCLYDHGTDPVVLEDVALSQVLTYGPHGPPDVPMQPPGVPHPLIHDMVPPMGSLPRMPPPMGMDHCPMGPPPLMVMQGPPPLVMRPPPNMEYSPNAPGMNSNMNWGRPPFRGMHPRPMHPHQPGMGFNQGQRALINVPVESNSHSLHKQNNVVPENHGHNDRRGGFEPNRPYTNSCLVLKKVPSGLNNITHLNNHFAKFGKIVNIQVNYENDPESAMITFSNPAEANAAIKSTEAVLNNRFIKVFWHNSNKEGGKHNQKDKFGSGNTNPTGTANNVPGDGNNFSMGTTKKPAGDGATKSEFSLSPEEKKAKTLAAIKKSQEMLEKNQLLRKKTEEKRKEALKLTSDLRKRTQILLGKQIEQQKALIKKLEIGGLEEKQKKDIMDTVKALQDSIEKIQQELVETTKKKIIPVKKTKEEIQKEILDTELDLMTKQQEGGDVSGLQKKISALKLELAKVQPKLVGSRPVARGQNKTIIGKNMSLNRTRATKVNHVKSAVDHRPTKILVSGYENDEKDLVLTHFRQFGEVRDYVADDSTPSIVLNYKTRQEAENAMVKGKSFQDRLLAVTWFTTNTNPQFRRRNSSGSGHTYHMHAGRQVLLSGSEGNLETEPILDNDESEIDHSLESNEDILLQDDDEDLEDEERSWRR
ncbi:hypothetical protein RUM43_001290 [Polyplax serrata]|uniref:RNA-binding protein 26 n=1 Tax=Polyplax serrata TaxID=468196 RepID=A0AAN8SEL0_POLSC